MLEKLANRYHEIVDAAWRALEKAHDLVAALRAHRLFPNRKVFGGAVVTALGFVAKFVLAKTGIDLGTWIPPAAGFITAYFFSDGPTIRHLNDTSHEAIDHEERLVHSQEAETAAQGD